jgi:hypothetical protein
MQQLDPARSSAPSTARPSVSTAAPIRNRPWCGATCPTISAAAVDHCRVRPSDPVGELE